MDPLANKREIAESLGATHSAADAEQAQQLVTELTRGVGADHALITVGVVTEDVIDAAFAAIRKRGTVVVTGLAGPGQKNIHLSSFELTLFQKRIEGALFGGGNPFDDIPLMLDLYRAGRLKLDELITTTVPAGGRQPGLPGPARRAEHPRCPDPRALSAAVVVPPHGLPHVRRYNHAHADGSDDAGRAVADPGRGRPAPGSGPGRAEPARVRPGRLTPPGRARPGPGPGARGSRGRR